MFITVVILLGLFWLLGIGLGVGSLIHLALVAALVVLLFDLVTRRHPTSGD
ncbi:lmo0937 family membrane protein [Candidatus Saccharibacteria bacterium]|nr:lmo0937 family membrane protein [Candidatus Saccharibacteria bacterium]